MGGTVCGVATGGVGRVCPVAVAVVVVAGSTPGVPSSVGGTTCGTSTDGVGGVCPVADAVDVVVGSTPGVSVVAVGPCTVVVGDTGGLDTRVGLGVGFPKFRKHSGTAFAI